MKKLLVIFFTLLCFISCKRTEPPLTVHAKIMGLTGLDIQDSTKHKIFKVNLSLINNSKETISFWTMSCSWQDNWLINTNYYYFYSKGCDNNGPKEVQIKPKDSCIYKAIVISDTPDGFGYIDVTRFGFIYIDTIQCKSWDDFPNIIGDKSLWKTIIWSNPIYFEKYK
jgi:hypothetical protein